MKKEYDFSNARRITPEEVEAGRKAIEAFTGKRRRRRIGRPPKSRNAPLWVWSADAGVTTRADGTVVTWKARTPEEVAEVLALVTPPRRKPRR